MLRLLIALLLVATPAWAQSAANTAILPLVFCGQGANSTNNYLGPANGIGAEAQPGGAVCDGLDSTTETTADAVPYGVYNAYYALGMICQLTDIGATNDTVTFTLGDDTADVTGFSCTTAALNGAGDPESCSVFLTPVLVSSGSAMNVRMTRSETGGADDLSGTDALCHVFVRF